METVVTARVPAAEFALSTTFEALPDVEAAVDPVVTSGGETAASVVRLRGSDRGALDDALGADPSVESVLSISYREEEDAHFYHMDWSEGGCRVLDTLTAANGRILDICGQHGHWRFRLRYPHREDLVAAGEHWAERGVPVDIERIHEANGRPSTDADFTGTEEGNPIGAEGNH